jgi:hypothetical protein
MDTDDDQVWTALAAHIGPDEAKVLLTKIVVYVNLPNLVKGMAKGPDAPETEAAALALVEDPALADALGLVPFAEFPTSPPPTTEYFWGLLTLAARADIGVLDRLEESITSQPFASRLVATIRRATTKRAVTQPTGAAGTESAEPPA